MLEKHTPEQKLLAAQQGFLAAMRDSAATSRALDSLRGDVGRNEELLAVYRGNAVANASKALALAYPVVEKIVGEEFFGGLCRVFWAGQPSRSGDLNEYGDGFAEFLAAFPHVADMPYLPDVARVEWSVSCALHAADHVPTDIAQLAQISPEMLGGLRFGLQPALMIMPSSWPVASIWQEHQAEFNSEISVDLENAECIAVHRLDLRVDVSRLNAGEAALWRAALDGAELGAMLEAAFTVDESFDVQAALQAGFAREFITSLQLAQD